MNIIINLLEKELDHRRSIISQYHFDLVMKSHNEKVVIELNKAIEILRQNKIGEM